MKPRMVAQSSDGMSVWSSAPCEHGTVTLGLADDRYPFPLVTTRCADYEAEALAVDLLLCGTRGLLEPN